MYNSLTSFECIFRESTLGVAVRLEADASPAVGETRWLCDAAAAMGTENKDRSRGDALLEVEANTLAIFVGFVGVGLRSCGRGSVKLGYRAELAFSSQRRRR
jgi:hypothetical protein